MRLPGPLSSLKKTIDTMDIKEELTDADVQSILRTRKLLGDMSNDFKVYHFAIGDQLENDKDAEVEQETLDQHKRKVMELVDCIVEIVGERSQKKKVQIR